MIIVNYKSKRELKKQVGKPLKQYTSGTASECLMDKYDPDGLFFVTNSNRTFQATVIMVDGLITGVR